MADITVKEKHSVSSSGVDGAEVEITISVNLPYKFVRSVEDAIYRFVENLKRIGCGEESPHANRAYSDEETETIRGCTRENVWETFKKKFPDSKRTEKGVITHFARWKQFEKMEKRDEVTVMGPVTPVTPLTQKEIGIVQLANIHLNKWQKKFIIRHAKEGNLIEKFRRKYPGVKLTLEMAQVVIDTGLPEIKKMKKPVESKCSLKAQVDEIVKAGERKFKPEDRVVQVSGKFPAYGTGVVQQVRPDGVVTVKFLSSTKVLHEDCFEKEVPKEPVPQEAKDAENNH